MCNARYEKPLKNHPLDVAKKYVETYSSSNAAARDPEERASYNIQVDSNQNTILKKKIKRANALTDRPRMTEISRQDLK